MQLLAPGRGAACSLAAAAGPPSRSPLLSPAVRPRPRLTPAEAERDAGGDQPGRGRADVLPHAGQVAGGDHRVRRQAVDLGLVEQQEERPAAADAVVRVVQVEPGLGLAGRAQVRHPQRGPLAQLVQRAELDRLGRAGLGAGRVQAGAEPVVAQRALVRLPVRPRAGR